MSNTPAYTNNSALAPERRLHMRQQLSALAYLDIGSDNGGIVLNLSEEGMALQAVSPLDSQKAVSLRIQLPHSRTRIETTARIVWLSESKRHAGVRFADMPSEARTQIHEWLRTQTSPHVILEGAPGQMEIASEPQKKQETVWEPRKDKWLSLMAKSEVPASADPTPPQIAGPTEASPDVPLERQTITGSPAAGSASGLGDRTAPPDEALPSKKSVLRQSAPSVPHTAPAKLAPPGPPNVPNSGYGAIAAQSHNRTDRHGILDESIPTSQAVPPTALSPSTLPAQSPERLSSRTESQASSVPTLASTLRAVPAATKKSNTRLWVAAGVLLATLSILSFGIGKWVGSRSARIHSMQAPKTPTIATPITEQSASPSNGRNVNESAPAIVHKVREEHAGGNQAPFSQELPLPTSSPLFVPPQQNVSSTPATQRPTAPTAAKSLESISASAPPDGSAQGVPPPTVVGGRTLRPMDRFNPCHLTYRVEPDYPLELQQQRLEGAVKIHLVIGADGTVHSTKLLSGSPLLAPAAMDAAKYWQYLPALLNGQPVETEQDIEIDFRLPH